MAEYRIIKKSDEKYHPEVKKKLFWHELKNTKQDTDGKKISFNSFIDARDFIFEKLKKEID